MVPAQLTDRPDQLVSDPLPDAFQTAEQLLASTVQLAETRSGADLTDFRAALAERRRSLSPPRVTERRSARFSEPGLQAR